MLVIAQAVDDGTRAAAKKFTIQEGIGEIRCGI